MDEADDRAQIMALIHANRIGMWTKDFDLWSACFVHSDYTTRWGYNAQNGPSVRRGWDDIVRRAGPLFEGAEMPANKEFAYNTTVQNLTLVIKGDMAWAAFDQQYPHAEFPGFRGTGLTHELRVFHREAGHWKIAVLGNIGSNGFHDGAAIVELAGDGSVRWASTEALRRLREDDDLMIRSGKLRVRDSACQRRLTAALSWASNVDNGYNPQRGRMPVVLGAGEGLPTRVWWVLVETGLIYFLMDEAGLSEARLDIAAAIFGLSSGQRKLAGYIAEGLSLPEAAKAMGVSTNTVRTHLHRIFEKTGVHNQPALVRVLLSVGAPA